MAVIEYMMVKDGPRRQVPDFVGDRGHGFNPIDNTYLGWVDDVRDYYVPDTVLTLTKQQCVERALRIHAVYPQRKFQTQEMVVSGTPGDIMNDAEVTAAAEEQYDWIVAQNTPNT
jgi:hypothetical protein